MDSSIEYTGQRSDENNLHSLRVHGALRLALNRFRSRECRFALLIVTVIALVPTTAAEAFPQRAAELQLLDAQTHELEDAFYPLGKGFTGGMEIATGDVTGDGNDYIVLAHNGGEGAAGMVRVLDANFDPLHEFLAFPEGASATEIDIAVGDIDGDTKDEIIVSQPRGPLYSVFIYDEEGRIDTMTAGALHFPYPVSVAIGDVVGTDGIAEILIGSGPDTAPEIQILDADGLPVAQTFAPFAQEETHGLSLGVLTQYTGNDTLAVGLQNGGKTTVKLYKISPTAEHAVAAEFDAWTKEVVSGVEFASVDIAGDKNHELAVSIAGDAQAQVRFFTTDGSQVDTPAVYAYEEDFRGGTDVAFLEKKNDGGTLLLVPHVQRRRGETSRGERFIEVDLSEQVTYLWENGYLRNSYLISSGLHNTPTPGGDYTILKKLPSHVYDGRPEYFYPNTPWNLRFIPGGAGGNYYFHTAYWHNNFGTPQSHGCINMREDEAEFLYHWADVGTPVTVHY